MRISSYFSLDEEHGITRRLFMSIGEETGHSFGHCAGNLLTRPMRKTAVTAQM